MEQPGLYPVHAAAVPDRPAADLPPRDRASRGRRGPHRGDARRHAPLQPRPRTRQCPGALPGQARHVSESGGGRQELLVRGPGRAPGRDGEIRRCRTRRPHRRTPAGARLLLGLHVLDGAPAHRSLHGAARHAVSRLHGAAAGGVDRFGHRALRPVHPKVALRRSAPAPHAPAVLVGSAQSAGHHDAGLGAGRGPHRSDQYPRAAHRRLLARAPSAAVAAAVRGGRSAAPPSASCRSTTPYAGPKPRSRACS